MMVSLRYARPLTALLGLALAPVVVHSYAGLRRDDCSRSTGTAPVPERLRHDFDAFDAELGTIAEPGVTLEWAVVRSFDAKKIYHHPEGSFVRGAGSPERRETVMADGGTLPVHRIQYGGGLAADYVLLYRGRAVANPYLEHLSAFPDQLIRGLRPMTLLLIHGRRTAPEAEARAAAWLHTKTKEMLACFQQN